MKKIKLLLIFIFLFSFTGCSSYTELNELGIVSLLGIDYQNDGYHLYINVVEGEQDDGTLQKQYVAYDAFGETLDEAFHFLYLKSNKKIYLSHMDVLLLSKEAINRRLQEIINYLLTHSEIRNNFELIELSTPISLLFEEKMDAKEISDLVKMNQEYMGTSYSVTFEHFLEDILIDSNSQLPVISFDKDLKVDGISLLKNLKILDTLSSEESVLYNLLNNHINQAIYKDTMIIKNETNIEIKKNQVIFHLHLEVNKNSNQFKENLQKDLRKILIYYQEKDYDLLKLKYKMKQNHLSFSDDFRTFFHQVPLKFDIEVNYINSYLERKISK